MYRTLLTLNSSIMPKITTIAPSAILATFIKDYQLLEFDTIQKELLKLWHALPQTYLIFFLKDKPVGLLHDSNPIDTVGRSNIWIQGLSTHYNGIMKFNGNYSAFMVRFTPNGLNKLLGLPLNEITNHLLEADGVLGKSSIDLLNRLQNATNIYEMAKQTDLFFKKYCSYHKYGQMRDSISFVANQIMEFKCQTKIALYAQRANMSPRNFERKFKEQVGTSPKLFCRSLRFNQAIDLKTEHPERSWTDISYECGYFDQMHLITDFKKLSNATPQNFFNNTPPPSIEYSFAQRNT